MNYIFIDESGDLGESSKNILISAISVDEPTKLERIIKKTRRYHKKQIGKTNEIKGFNIPPKIIRRILKKLNKIDYEIYVFSTKKINTK